MNRIAIVLRQTVADNIFRQTILSTLRLELVDSAMICSGFFQEDPSHSASQEFDISGFRPCKPLQLTTVGLYNWGKFEEYMTYGSGLHCINCLSCISIRQRVIKSKKWHAKVFIAKSASQPVVGIIGSSNITRPAFGLSNPFNHESDVIFWDEANKKVNELMEGLLEANVAANDAPSVFIANYDNEHLANRDPLSKKLLDLETLIENMSTAI